MDDDDALDRLLDELGLELPTVADDGEDNLLPPRFDEGDWE